MPSKKTSWSSSSCQEHHIYHKTIGNATYGLFGHITYIRICSNKYGLVIVDDYSSFTWVFFLQDKSETQEVLKKFMKRTQNKFDAKVEED
jgi:hypothetical protein